MKNQLRTDVVVCGGMVKTLLDIFVNELFKQMRTNMEILEGSSSDEENIISTPNGDTSDNVNIADLEKQLRLFKEQIRLNSTTCNNNNKNSNNNPRRLSLNSPTSPTSAMTFCKQDNYTMLSEEREFMTKENRNLKEEATRLRNENYVLKKQLDEEANARQRLQRELHELGKLLETMKHRTHEKQQFESINEISNEDSSSLHENISTSPNRKKSANGCDTSSFYEKLKTSFSSDEVKERDELRHQNIELEKKLNDAKKIVRSHEKRLLAFSSQLSNPNSMNLTYNLKPQTYPKASSCPSSPSNTYQQSVFRKHYDRPTTAASCKEQYLNVSCETMKNPARRFNSCDSISAEHAFSTKCCNQGFDWRYDMDVLARKPRSSSEHSKFCENKSI